VSTVVVERAFPTPVTFVQVQHAEERSAGCLDAHGVRFQRTYLSHDGLRMVCLYEAPDAEAVRRAQTAAGLPFERAWTTRPIRYDGPETGPEAFVAEREFPVAIDEAALRGLAADKAWCLERWGCRTVWSLLSLDGRRCLCVYAAPDAEAVRQAQRLADVPWTTVWAAAVHGTGVPG